LQATSQLAISVTGTGKMTTHISVFDGHNDVLLRLYRSTSSDAVSDFLDGEAAGHIDLKKARAGAFVGGLFAMYSPSPGNFSSLSKQMTGGSYAVRCRRRCRWTTPENPSPASLRC